MTRPPFAVRTRLDLAAYLRDVATCLEQPPAFNYSTAHAVRALTDAVRILVDAEVAGVELPTPYLPRETAS